MDLDDRLYSTKISAYSKRLHQYVYTFVICIKLIGEISCLEEGKDFSSWLIQHTSTSSECDDKSVELTCEFPARIYNLFISFVSKSSKVSLTCQQKRHTSMSSHIGEENFNEYSTKIWYLDTFSIAVMETAGTHECLELNAFLRVPPTIFSELRKL